MPFVQLLVNLCLFAMSGGVEEQDQWPFIPIDSRMSDFSLHRDDSVVTLGRETFLNNIDF